MLKRYSKGELIFPAVMLFWCLVGLIGCCLPEPKKQQPVILQGNWMQAVYSSSSAGKKELKYYRIGPEALARLLEKAEACK